MQCLFRENNVGKERFITLNYYSSISKTCGSVMDWLRLKKAEPFLTLPCLEFLQLHDSEQLWVQSAFPQCMFYFSNVSTSAKSCSLPFFFQSPKVSDLADFANGQPCHTLQVCNVNIRFFVKLTHNDFF